ncbi:MAG: DNA polymerase III subunit beta [Candidatus Nanopelagicaceae bacterium]
MKFTVDSAVLTDALHWVSRSLSNRPTNSALHGIVIEAGKEVHLSATDLETSAKAHFQAEITTQGKVLVPGKLLSDIAKALPNKSVSFSLEGSRVQVTAGKSKFQLPTIPNSEYPTLPPLPQESGSIKTSLFTEAISQVAIAASKDDSLPKLTGIHIEINEDRITLAATDRYRLAVRELLWQPSTPGFSTTVLMRARTLLDAAKAISPQSTLSLSIAGASTTDRLVGLATDGKTMTTRVLDGEFPPFRHLLPNEVAAEATINVSEFIESIRRVSLVTDKSIPLRLNLSTDQLLLEAGSGEDATATEELDIDFQGDSIQIAFNPTFLMDGLTALTTPFATISFTAANRQAVIRGKNEKSGPRLEEYSYLIMPTRYTN